MIRITIEQSEPWPHENNPSRTKDTKLYEQSVMDLDIPAVIAVVNGLRAGSAAKAPSPSVVMDEVVAVRGQFIEVNNSRSFIGVSVIYLRESPHFDVCARLPILPISTEMEHQRTICVADSHKLIGGVVKAGMRVQGNIDW